MSKVVIIGPSKVGKTAIVSSLQQAVNTQTGTELTERDIDVLSANEQTGKLFKSALRLIIDGFLPFAGTASVIDYEFKLSVTQESSGIMKIVHDLFNIQNVQSADIQFPDAPGGALFEGDDEEVDYVLMRQYRERLISLIKECDGLIICVDISMLNGRKDRNSHYQVALEFAKWIPSLLEEALFGTKASKVNINRVAVVLTKADLWAAQQGHTTEAEHVVGEQDPYQLTEDLLGAIFINTLRRRFKPTTEIAFCMSSVYGFLDGAPNPLFGQQSKRKDRRSDPMIDPNLWKPYNVIEPFMFLLTGENIQNRFVIKKAGELRPRG